eukprot:6451658-Prymnesium_polylepis.1
MGRATRTLCVQSRRHDTWPWATVPYMPGCSPAVRPRRGRAANEDDERECSLPGYVTWSGPFDFASRLNNFVELVSSSACQREAAGRSVRAMPSLRSESMARTGKCMARTGEGR